MSKELEALERIKDDLEYVTRLDYVNPIVRGEVRDELYKIYHRELPDLDIIETSLKEKEQQDGVIQILKEIIEFSQVLPHIEPNKDNGFHIMSAVGINIQRDIENKERELLRQWILKTCFPKELKALEIIKELAKSYYVAFCDNDQTMNFRILLRDKAIWQEIAFKNKEKFDILKEVLL